MSRSGGYQFDPAGDVPNETDKFPRDCRYGDVATLAVCDEPPVSPIQTKLRLPGDVLELLIQLWAVGKLPLADFRCGAIAPRRLEQKRASSRIACLDDSTLANGAATGMLPRNEAEP